MRMKLKWKVAGAYAALIAALALCLSLYIERRAEDRLTEGLRSQLAIECHLARRLLATQTGPAAEARAKELTAATGARVTMVAPGGQVLADSEAVPATMEPHDTRPEIQQARQLGVGWAIRHSMTLGVDMLYVAESTGPDRPTIRLSMPLAEVQSATRDLRHTVLMAWGLAALVAILLGAWLTGGITRSLGDLALAARRIGNGELSARAHVHSGDETQDLADALNSMAEGLSSARADLERSAAHLQAVLAQMADGTIVVAADETVQLFNAAAGKLFTTDPAAAVGRRLSEAVHSYELVELSRRAIRLRTAVWDEVLAGDGTPRVLAAAASPLAGDHAEILGVVITLRDVSELKRLELVRRDFVANASHELRTPVASIRSLAETLQGGALGEPALAQRFLGQIVTSTANLGRLLDDMLALATLEAAEERPAPQSLDVRAMLREAAARLGPQATEKHITVETDAPAGLAVWCSEQSLMAALVNLVDNAVKYTPEGGHVILGASPANGQTQLTVTDTGPGVPEADRDRVFERFYRVDKGRSRALGGTGLGLSIVRHAVEGSGGRVWLEAPPEGGTRAVVRLPATPA